MFGRSFTQKTHLEEDTFRRLRGYEYEEVRVELIKLLGEQARLMHFFRYMFRSIFDKKNCTGDYIEESVKERDELFKRLGWTHERYVNELVKEWI
jgi:hypothetical protein